MVCAPSLFAPLVLFITPFVYALKSVPSIQIKVNTALQMVFYLPLGLGSVITFTFWQIVYCPYAFYYTIKSKRKIIDW